MDSVGEEEGVHAGVVELTSIVALDGFHQAPNCVRTCEKKFASVEKVSDLTRRGKVHRQ